MAQLNSKARMDIRNSLQAETQHGALDGDREPQGSDGFGMKHACRHAHRRVYVLLHDGVSEDEKPIALSDCF